MRIKRKTAARLASISALGAGALGVAAGTAEAGIISHTFPHGTVVGPDGASSVPVFCLPAYNSTYPNAFRIARTTFNEGNSTGGFKGWAVFASGDGVRFQGGSVLDILMRRGQMEQLVAVQFWRFDRSAGQVHLYGRYDLFLGQRQWKVQEQVRPVRI